MTLTELVANHLRPQAYQSRPVVEEVKETQEQLNERMHQSMNQSKVVLFMKGHPDSPRCGFSKQAVQLLRDQNVDFTHFDILQDEAVRQGEFQVPLHLTCLIDDDDMMVGLKVLNQWPTFPQFIVNGEFIGGLDVVKEMVANGEFAEVMA